MQYAGLLRYHNSPHTPKKIEEKIDKLNNINFIELLL